MISLPLLTPAQFLPASTTNAKVSGNADLGPANCWVGVDAPRSPTV